MSVATLFQGDRSNRSTGDTGARTGRDAVGQARERLKSLVSGGFGADSDVPDLPPGPAPASAPTRSRTSADSGEMPLRDYLRGLDSMIRRSEQEQIRQTLGSVSPNEVQALVQKTAKAKARYIAASLDLAEGDTLPDSGAVKALEAERERHEALESSLRMLLGELRSGHVKVTGVDDDPTDTWQYTHRFE